MTRAHRTLDVEGLPGLDQKELRRLCQGLLLGDGLNIEDHRSTHGFDEFTVSLQTIWHDRRSLVRLFYLPLAQPDIEEVVADLSIADALEAVVISTHPLTRGLVVPRNIHIVPPKDFVGRFISSPLVEWENSTPRLSIERLSLFLDLTERTFLLDPVGIQWLPSLALNELPPAFAGIDVEPQDLFERKTFRLLTASFGLDGIRYGEATRGKRLPDSVVHWLTAEGSGSALIDCKAASSGYQMDADHLLRFIHYWEALGPELLAEGRTLTHIIIVSSYFPGPMDMRHSFHGRAREIFEKTGLRLSYVKAADLCFASAQIEAEDLPLASRRSIPWPDILEPGLVSQSDFDAALSVIG